MGKLPFAPESTEDLRRRYPAALVELFDAEQIMFGTQLRAGQRRSNVFDFPSGIRLIVSREDNGGRAPRGFRRGIHISGSVEKGMPIFHDLRAVARHRGKIALVRAFRQACEVHFWSLSDDPRRLRFLGHLDGRGLASVGVAAYGVPHWFVPESDDDGGNPTNRPTGA